MLNKPALYIGLAPSLPELSALIMTSLLSQMCSPPNPLFTCLHTRLPSGFRRVERLGVISHFFSVHVKVLECGNLPRMLSEVPDVTHTPVFRI